MRRLVLAFVLATAAPLLSIQPANAAGEVVPYMAGGVLYDSCGEYPYSYTLNLPVGFDSYWNMDFRMVGPDGNEVDTDYEYTSSTDSPDFFICDSPNLAGNYRISGEGEACNADYDCVAITASDYSVSFRLPRTRTKLTASPTNPSPGEVVRFVILTRDERPNGYFPASYAEVALQVRVDGFWRAIGGRQMTDSRGREVIKARYKGGRKWLRAVTFREDDYTGSKSTTVKIR